jgi:heterodisulfide reductase subunit A
LTLSEVNSISGEEGDFEVTITQHPRYVDMDKCIACGLCAEKCPRKVPNSYDGNLANRKAIYVQYAQAVPLKYAIDPEYCLKLTKGKCGICQKKCPTGAINYEDTKKDISLKVGAVVLSQGTETFNPSVHDTFGYKKYPNIVTSLEFERILSASGPYGGHLVRPSDKKEPEKIAWLQCIGSRDEHIGARGYCSGVCCTYAIKEAMLAKEHSKSGLDTAIFYIDIRTNGKDFEKYYNRAKNESGVRFVKSKVTGAPFVEETGKHLIRYIDESGKRCEEEFDMVVLSVGLGVTQQGADLGRRLGVELNHYNFAETSSFAPVDSSVPGIYVCGAFQGPKDIPSSVIDSSAAAGVVGSRLSDSRWSRTKTKEVKKEKNVAGDPPRIGVFVCCCGTNIAGVVNVPEVVEYASKLSGVVYAEQNMFSCAQDTQDKMAELIREKNLNRIVVAACTPKTHEPLFQETLQSAGINKYLFEMVNIRNQCSWVHKQTPEEATEKSKDLVRMSVAKAAQIEPLKEPVLEINQRAMVIGGGISGMVAADNLAAQGYEVDLVERENALGGNALSLYKTWKGEDIAGFVKQMVEKVKKNPVITVHAGSSIKNVDGFVGAFSTTIEKQGAEETLDHGVTIIASGASELKPEGQYLYGKDDRVVTGLELQNRLARRDKSLEKVKTAVFIQCVGSRIPERPYCSKLCCTQSIRSALELKENKPETDIYIVYRDMRPYSLREDLYRKAREKGIKFLRYNFDKGMDVTNEKGDLKVSFTDFVLRRTMFISPDLLVLASAIVREKNDPLARFFKVTQNDDGFYVEAHLKLRPVDFATDGVFLCGLAHGPKPVDESIAQAQAAAARAVTLLSAKTIPVSGTVAQVNPQLCCSCGVCVSVCPYSAPRFSEKTDKAEIESALCKGCGLCVASCRSGAIELKGFGNSQIMSMIDMSMAG